MGNGNGTQPTPDASTTEATGYFSWSEDMELTDELERVARNIGCEERVIERMKADGVDEGAYWHIAPALATEQHLEEKYGIGFTAIDCYYNLSDNQSDTDACMVRLTADDGSGPAEGFLARCDWSDDAAHPVWTETYFASYIAEPYDAYVTGLIADAVAACESAPVVAATIDTYTMFGDDMGPDTPIEDVARANVGALTIYVRDVSGLTEETYDADVAAITEAARATGLHLLIDAACITNLPETTELTPQIGDSARREYIAPSTGADLSGVLPGAKWKRSDVVNKA